MTIETRFNIGDEVWTIVNDEVTQTKITALKADQRGSILDLVWELDVKTMNTMYCLNAERIESQLFKTKEELIASL